MRLPFRRKSDLTDDVDEQTSVVSQRRRQVRRRLRNRDLDRLGWYELRRKPITTTTRQAEALNLALVETNTHMRGWISGLDVYTDQPTHLDPFELYKAKVVQSPNVLMVGDVGMGKSSVAKTDYVLRPLSVGIHVAVIDKKEQQGRGEYDRTCSILGIKPVRFSRDGSGTIINPLDPRILGLAAGDTVGQDTLLRMIAELVHGGPLGSLAVAALNAAHSLAVRRATEQGREAVLSDIVALLLNPEPEMVPAQWLTLEEYRQWGLEVGLDLQRACKGDLAGLVDGPTSDWLDLDAPLVVFDISTLDEDGPAIAIVMAIANTFLTQAWARKDGVRRLLVAEEGYHLISYESCAQIMKRNLKQGRGRGMGVVTVIHHLSDIPQTNDAIAAIKEASIIHIFSQAKDNDALDCVQTFGLPSICRDLISDLTQGHYLLQIGKQPPRVVRHLRSSLEIWATDTDDAMHGTTGETEAPVVTGVMAGQHRMNTVEASLLGGAALGALGCAAYLHGRLQAKWAAMGRTDAGVPDKRAVRAAYGLDARRTEMAWVRPGLTVTEDTPAGEMGLYLGHFRPAKTPLYGPLEEAVLVLGPPRMNKTTGELLEAILSTPGAGVVTSLRPDSLLYTATERAKRGPVLCWDAEGVARWPHKLRWNPLRGCETHAGALRRAGSFVCGGGATVDEDFWSSGAVTLLRCLLHAAAIDPDTRLQDIRKWVANRQNERPLDILSNNPQAIDGYADELRGELSADPKTADGVYRTAARAVACLADPAAMDLCTPPKEDEFDPYAFVQSKGTVYLLCRPKIGGMAPLVTALVDELTEAVYQVGSGSSGERLDPICRFVLDECATVGPPGLVDYASFLGGSGGQLVISFQSWAQARKKYTDNGAEALWTNCTTKVILGGLDVERDLRHVSTLLGDRDEHYTTSTRPRGGGNASVTTHVRRMPVMSPAQIQEMPKGRQLIIATGRPKVITDMPALRQRPDWPQLNEGLAQTRRITGRDLEEQDA